jgi:hypothetical protein
MVVLNVMYCPASNLKASDKSSGTSKLITTDLAVNGVTDATVSLWNRDIALCFVQK